jgi:hypothetical protein
MQSNNNETRQKVVLMVVVVVEFQGLFLFSILYSLTPYSYNNSLVLGEDRERGNLPSIKRWKIYIILIALVHCQTERDPSKVTD